MRKYYVLFVMLFTMFATTYSQSLNETVKNVSETAKTINQTVKVLIPDTIAVIQGAPIKEEVEALPDSNSITSKEVYNDFKSGLIGIANALKVGVEHVYYVLVKQQIVKAVMWLLLGIFGFIFILAYKRMYEFGKKNSYDSDGASWIPFVLQMFVGVVLIGLFLGNIDTIVTGFINPEFGAMKDIVEFVNELKNTPPAQ